MTSEPNPATDYVRQLEDALHILWGELPMEQVKILRDEAPALVDFLVHLHHSLGHEQAMTRRNVWAAAPMGAAMTDSAERSESDDLSLVATAVTYCVTHRALGHDTRALNACQFRQLFYVEDTADDHRMGEMKAEHLLFRAGTELIHRGHHALGEAVLEVADTLADS